MSRLVDPPDHRWPIYVLSKGRAGKSSTIPHLESMGCRFRIVVEDGEAAEYASTYPDADLLVIDPRHSAEYDPLDGHGRKLPLGSGPARNAAWEHAAGAGAAKHWIVDDNIYGWGVYIPRGSGNRKKIVRDASAFTYIERFVDGYSNIALAAHQYAYFFAPRDGGKPVPPVIWNTRVMSSILVMTSLPFRWSGRYNEDVILSIEALRRGWCTMLHQGVLADKASRANQPNQKGGNTDTVYRAGSAPKTALLHRLYPNMVKRVRIYGRSRHRVDFGDLRRNRPIRIERRTPQ